MLSLIAERERDRRGAKPATPEHDDEPTVAVPVSPPRGERAEFADAVTGILSLDALEEKLARMREDRRDTVTQPPAQNGGSMVRDLRRRWGVLGAVLLLLVVGVTTYAGLRWWKAGARPMYVADAAVLIDAPGQRRDQGIPLQRGDALKLFTVTDRYAVVRDGAGHVGYVLRSALSLSRPVSMPDIPFAGCRRGIAESTSDACRDRAIEQRGSCESYCERVADDPTCFKDCGDQAQRCLAACEKPTR